MKYRLYSGVEERFVSDKTWDNFEDAYCEKCEQYTPEEFIERDIFVEEFEDARPEF